MRFILTTVSPIHIGNGETLKPLSYITDQNYVYIINMSNFFEYIKGHQLITDYLNWIDPIINKLALIERKFEKSRDDLEQRKALNKQRRETEQQLSLDVFLKNKLKKNPFEFLKDCILYKSLFNVLPQSDGFKPFIKNGNGSAYIPGTEIKGTIRTSLLYYLIEQKHNYGILKREIEILKSLLKSGESPKEKRKKIKDIESKIEEKFLRGLKNKAYFDFCRFFMVSDTTSIPPKNLKIETAQMLGTQRYTKTWVETVTPDTTVEFDLSVHKNIDLIPLGLERLKGLLDEEKILEACYYRSQAIFEEEKSYFSKSYLASYIESLQAQNKKDSPLIRIGAGQGFLGVTIDLILKNKDNELYDVVRNVVSYLRRWRTYRNNFPKTRRVIINRIGKEISLLGWAKIRKKND